MSLKKIASMTGVSVSTVSRVLNDASPTCASKETKDKVWKAAREIGYRPNEAARQLKKSDKSIKKSTSSTTSTITIILARVTSLEADPFFFELFRHLEIELMKEQILIQQVIYAEESLTQTLPDSDGIIILGRCSRALLSHITSLNRNVVGIWRNSMNFDVDEVICDGEKAAEIAMHHLLSLGHKNIAYIGDCSYESRYIGYCNTLIQNHLSMDYSLIKHTNQSAEEAEKAFLSLLENRSHGKADFSAVFCANDASAIRVLELLQKQKKKTRTSISVISIDDIDDAQNTKPYLTTVHIPREGMAHMAVKLLTDRIEGGHTDTVRIEFSCRIMNRESCYANAGHP